MGIEEQIDRLIYLGEDIKSRLDLLVEIASDHFVGAGKMVAEEPAKEPEPEPAWEPKVGDWVKVTKPKKQDRGDDPIWLTTMDQYDGKVFQVKELIRLYQWPSVMCDGINYAFKIDWLSPAEPPQPEYREPVLPADAGQPCEFSMTEKDWYSSLLAGFQVHNNPWISSDQGRWNFARIKKDA